MFTVTRADFSNSAQNTLYGVAHVGAGFLTALGINVAVHKFFKIQKDSYKSYIIKAGAFLAGTE